MKKKPAKDMTDAEAMRKLFTKRGAEAADRAVKEVDDAAERREVKALGNEGK